MDSRAITIYIRVSKRTQDQRSQEPELKAWFEAHARSTKVLWFRDKHTGRTLKRPSFQKLEKKPWAGEIRRRCVAT